MAKEKNILSAPVESLTEGVVKSPSSLGIDLNKIIAKAKTNFSAKAEKGLALQITTGSNISRPNKDSDFVLYPGQHWQLLTGVRGIPFGRVVQISGRSNSGKTSHSCGFMKEAQDKGHIVILWDTENKFSATRFDNYFKGNSSELLLVTSKVILEGADMVVAIARAALEAYPNKKLFIVWDSVGGTLSSAEDSKALRESRQMAMAAKENGQALHSWVNLMEEFKNKETNEERVGVLLINQCYANIGSVGQVESGGQKVEYYSSIIVQLTRKGDICKVRDKVKRKLGILSKARVKKNHLFDGEDTIAELTLAITAGEISLADENLKESDSGWEAPEEESSDE